MSDPLKLDKAQVPAGATKTTNPATIAEANAAFAANVKAEFDKAKVALKLDVKSVPSRASASDVPTKAYHIGCIPGSPHQVMYVGNVDFPMQSSTRIPGSAKDKPPVTIDHMGTVKRFSDEQLKALIEASARQAWRWNGRKGDKNASRRWQSFDLNDSDNRFLPGDVLLASFIYIRPLAEGETLPVGVLQTNGAFMPTPETLYPDLNAVRGEAA